MWNFYPRSPYGERPVNVSASGSTKPISIHALLTESDAPPYNLMIHHRNFYPRSPYGERQFRKLLYPGATRNFYPRSPYGERLSARKVFVALIPISIHALLTESDLTEYGLKWLAEISIHALLTESDLKSLMFLLSSTNFYPRSPYGERRQKYINSRTDNIISIHALLTESDNSPK